MSLDIVKPVYIIFFLQLVFSQPDLRFNPFDWNFYGYSGSINSISFGDRYAFIGTEGAGVLRFNVNNNRFEEAITSAQGLGENFITAVHYSESGMLWVATNNALYYSYSSYGDWRRISFNSIGLVNRTYIDRLGDDGKDIWVESSGMLFRLDGSTGIPLETMVRQNKKVKWSSGSNQFNIDYSDILFKYNVSGGWMSSLNTFINPDGENVKIRTIAESDFNQIVIGCNDGTFFVGNKNMRILEPYKYGLSSKDVYAFEGTSGLWAGGRTYGPNSGISYFDINRNIYENYYFKNIINIDETPIFSILDYKKMIFFGGNEKIITYDKKKDSWNQIYLPSGSRSNFVKNIIFNERSMWIATPNGLQIIDSISNDLIENEVTDALKNIFIHDLLFFKNNIYLATESGLLIYNNKNSTLYDYADYGYRDKEITFPSSQTSFTAIATSNNDVYFSTHESIIKLDTSNRTWSKTINSAIYQGEEIIDFDVHKNDFFIATVNKLTHYNNKKKVPDYFNYNFLGNINKLKVDSRKLWIGTSEGMFSYRYK